MNINKVFIREATLNDINGLSKLISQLGYPISVADMTQSLSTYLNNNNYYVYVAVFNETVVGVASVIINDYFHKIGRIAIVTAFCIDETHRRAGIGKLLMNFVEQQAKYNSCNFVELKSGLHRIKDGSHNFYKKLGYIDNAANQTYFKKRLI